MLPLAFLRRKIRYAAAVVFLAIIAVASAGQSARVGGEVSAMLQNPGMRPVAAVLLAAPILLSLRKRSAAAKAD
jgi:hypothetical protein